jgi:GntR family transcriptional regulator, transcriptional repressor for pyruvate dehydrogenase complex
MTKHWTILQKITALIESGQLAPGDKLPPERTLAETFNVSRNSVREAIRVLSEKGILESRQGAGTYVTARDKDVLSAGFEEVFTAQRTRLKQIFEVRRILEPCVAELAAERASQRDIEELKILVCDQQRCILSNGDDADLDARFHLVLGRASGNTILSDLLAALNVTIDDSRSDVLRTPGRRKHSPEAHLRIIDAVERRDGALCHALMVEHLLTVEKEVFGGEEDSE